MVVRIIVLLCWVLSLTGCYSESVSFPKVTDVERQVAMEKWGRSCALCHVDGNAGAPQVGDAVAWEPRLEQSTAMLLDHTINGLGAMPPLGYCMDCTEREFLILTEFMSGSLGHGN